MRNQKLLSESPPRRFLSMGGALLTCAAKSSQQIPNVLALCLHGLGQTVKVSPQFLNYRSKDNDNKPTGKGPAKPNGIRKKEGSFQNTAGICRGCEAIVHGLEAALAR